MAPAEAYHVAVRHRNHLGVMTAGTVALSGTTTVLDLSNGSVALKGGSQATDQTTATHADQQAVGQASSLLLDLACQRARAGHDLGLVVGVGQQRAALRLSRQAGGQCLRHFLWQIFV